LSVGGIIQKVENGDFDRYWELIIII